MSKTNVTNNHDGNLSVAGVDITPGATAAVDTIKLKQWLNGHAAKTWVEQEVISIDGELDTDADGEDDRDSLVAQANALGIEFHPNTGNKKLKELIEAAQAE